MSLKKAERQRRNMKTVFITGATHNTGFAIAQKYAANGYNVAISSRNEDNALKAAECISMKYDVKAKGYKMMLTDIDSIKCVFNNIEKDFGNLDVFVGNAANLGVDMGLLNSNEDEYRDVIDTNLKGNFFCCKYAAQIMTKQRSGAIVIIGSVHNRRTIQGRALYTASKGALLSLVKSMAVELGAYGIRANYISAGAIHTDRWNNLTDDEYQIRRGRYPIGTESYGEDIANGVYYLGSDLSRTVTGSELTIDSGISVCLLPFTKPKNFKE